VQPARCEAYPNPFADRLTISYQLERSEPVTCRLYDAAGNRVADLPGGIQSAGTHSLRWDVAHLAPGVYFCEFATSTWVRTYRLAKAN